MVHGGAGPAPVDRPSFLSYGADWNQVPEQDVPRVVAELNNLLAGGLDAFLIAEYEKLSSAAKLIYNSRDYMHRLTQNVAAVNQRVAAHNDKVWFARIFGWSKVNVSSLEKVLLASRKPIQACFQNLITQARAHYAETSQPVPVTQDLVAECNRLIVSTAVPPDALLVVGGQEFPFHQKMVAQSAHLKLAFSEESLMGGGAEPHFLPGAWESVPRLELQGISAQGMAAALLECYGAPVEVTLSNAAEILQAANYCGLPDLGEKAQLVLAQGITTVNWWETTQMAGALSAATLKRACLAFLKANESALPESDRMAFVDAASANPRLLVAPRPQVSKLPLAPFAELGPLEQRLLAPQLSLEQMPPETRQLLERYATQGPLRNISVSEWEAVLAATQGSPHHEKLKVQCIADITGFARGSPALAEGYLIKVLALAQKWGMDDLEKGVARHVGCVLGEGGLADHVELCQRVRHLYFGGHTSNGQPDAAPITDQGLVNVASHCPNLRGVQLVNCDIDGSGLERMVAPKLISIDISHCDKLDAHYVAKFVQKQPQLEEFDIPDKGMSDYVLQCLVNSCPGLRRLGVAGCRDTTITWAAVQFPQLTHLSLHHGIGNEGLEVLAGCVPCLQTLEIERPSAEALLAACRRLPYLQEVRITAAREFRLNPSLLIELPDACPGLRRLHLSESRFSAEAYAQAVPKWAHLEELQVNNSQTGDAELSAIAQHCPRLCRLDASGSALTGAGARALASAGLPLIELDLRGTRVDRTATGVLLRDCPALTGLRLFAVSVGIDPAEMQRFPQLHLEYPSQWVRFKAPQEYYRGLGIWDMDF